MGHREDRVPALGDRDEPTAEGWARRLRQGEPDAVQEVRQRVGKILTHRGLAIPPGEREDVEQEVMTEIWQAVNRSGFDLSGGFWGFVEVVTSRRCIDWLRAYREKVPLPADVAHGAKGPLRETLERERTELASTILGAVDSRCRELIGYRLGADLSYGEIARLTGRSEGALRVQLYRCIRHAREIMERLAADRPANR